ncbi:MAG: hypothetical protein ACIALR_10040 [Blastopirellula sp. JB062]
MNLAKLRTCLAGGGNWIVLGLALVALTVAYAAPGICGACRSAIEPAAPAERVAWRGRVYRRAYYGPAVRPVYRAPYVRRYYGPVYRPYPYGGAVVTPYARVYW